MADPDFRPTAPWSRLQTRADLLKRLRAYFDREGFLEVETPVLSHETVIDRHLDPIPVRLHDEDSGPPQAPLWLQTSPEFAMKRMLAAGGPSIFQVTKAFRSGEIGPLHNPEFTMVEWYRVGDALEDAMEFTSRLAEHLLARGRADRRSYQDLMHDLTQVDPWDADLPSLHAAAERRGIATPGDCDRDLLLDLLLVECVQPQLGRQQPTIVYHFPPTQAALARVVPDHLNRPVAERFELYVDGIELANGYCELHDAEEYLRRSRASNAARESDGKPRLPDAPRFVRALQQGLPSCSGVALGFDRLVMVATGATCIQDVMSFPISRA